MKRERRWDMSSAVEVADGYGGDVVPAGTERTP